MTQRAKLLLAFVSGALLACVAWIGAVVPRGATGATAESGLVTRRLEDLARAQERTLVVLERLAARWEDELVPPTRSALRTELGSAGELATASLEGLIVNLDALRASLEVESRRTNELLRSARALGGESLVEVRARRPETDWPALERLEQSWRVDASAAESSQLFQTPRDLLEAYGPPTGFRPETGRLILQYGEPPRQWLFHLQEGIVIRVELYD